VILGVWGFKEGWVEWSGVDCYLVVVVYYVPKGTRGYRERMSGVE